MKKIVKFLVWFFVVIILLVAFVISVPFIFKDKVRDIVVEQINNNVNATVEFQSYDLTVFSSFPDLRFELNKLTTVGLDTFVNDTLINLESLQLSIDIMSVFGDEIKINGISLISPNINAKVLANGKANWDIAKESDEAADTSTASSEPTKFKMSLKTFEIVSANIVYNDKSMDLNSKIQNFNFSLSGDFTQDVTNIKTVTTMDAIDVVFTGIKYLNKTKIEIIADLEANLKDSKYTFTNNSFKLNELELGLDGFVSMPTDDISMDLKFDAKKTEFKNILSLVPAVYMTDFESVKTSGTLALNGFAKGIYNETSLPAFGVKLQIGNAMFKYPDLPKSADNINIDIDINNPDGVTDHTVVDIKKFHIEFASNPIDISMLIKTPVSDADINGKITGKIDFATLKDIVPLDSMTMDGQVTADISLKGKMSSIEQEKYEEFNAVGNMHLTNFKYSSNDLAYGVTIVDALLNFTPQYLELQTFSSEIGKSNIELTGKIENYLAYTFKDELLKGNFNFNSSYLDLNEFMSDDETAATPTTPAEVTPMSVIEVPKNLDFTLQSKIAKILYDKLDITNTSGLILIKDGVVDLSGLSMNLLDGQINLSGKYDTKDLSKPNIDFNIKMTGFDIQKTYAAFNTIQKIAPVGEHCTGIFSAEFTLSSLLNKEMSPVMNSLQSQGILATKSIVITNSKMFDKLAEQLKADQFKKLALNDINLKFSIKDGKISVEPFDTKFSKSVANIGGFMDLDQNLDFKIKLKIPRSELGGAANEVVNDLFGQVSSKTGLAINPSEVIDINALIGGTSSNPTVKLDLKDQASNAVDDLKDKAKAELDKQKAELERKAKEQADKLKADAEAKANKLKSDAEAKAKAEADRLKREAEAAAAKAKKDAEDKAKEEAKKKLNGLFK
ncbi:MAG: hypothetical protein A2033_17755 [Bacteroidetes bacterium GWA2_31_9]|nr:MAG: hypothetical protein A2033_17755 [Bacteroidetes bacterium GWA2_31_9]